MILTTPLPPQDFAILEITIDNPSTNHLKKTKTNCKLCLCSMTSVPYRFLLLIATSGDLAAVLAVCLVAPCERCTFLSFVCFTTPTFLVCLLSLCLFFWFYTSTVCVSPASLSLPLCCFITIRVFVHVAMVQWNMDVLSKAVHKHGVSIGRLHQAPSYTSSTCFCCSETMTRQGDTMVIDCFKCFRWGN